MYVRKTKTELSKERASRKGKTKGAWIAAIVAFLFILLEFKLNQHGPSRSWEQVFAEGILWAIPFSALIFFFAKRGFEWTGSHFGGDEWVCIGCNKGFGISDNSAHGLLVFGRRKKKSWEIRACNTPDLCDIAKKHEARWVDDDV